LSTEYNYEMQTLFLRMMVTNAELYTRVMNIMNPSNFDRKLKPVAEFIVEHSKKYNIMPEPDQIKAVTSINVDVSSGGIKTTYQMDLYTASFGKLQKQKGDEISKISRERKKLISERNALIRKGLGKNQNRRNFLAEINMMRAGVMPSLDMMGLGMANSMSNFAVSINRQQVKNWSSLGQAVGTAGAELNLNEYSVGGSVQNAEAAGQIAGNFISTTNLAEKMQSTAIASVPEIFSAASNGPHPILPGTIQRGDASNSILWDGGNAPDQYVG